MTDHLLLNGCVALFDAGSLRLSFLSPYINGLVDCERRQLIHPWLYAFKWEWWGWLPGRSVTTTDTGLGCSISHLWNQTLYMNVSVCTALN